MSTRLVLAALSCFCILSLVPAPARAAKSYDNCTGFVDSVPAVITTQGTWCLRADLSSALSSGSLIRIATNNVTLDCNDFKLGGLAAGPGTLAVGVAFDNTRNTVIRNCNIRGLRHGARAVVGSGHVIEHNRFEGNTLASIHLDGVDATVRGNLLQDSGGAPGATFVYGMIVLAGAVDILDNTVNGVQLSGATGIAAGIYTQNLRNSVIAHNRVREVVGAGASPDLGIYVQSAGRTMIHDNAVIGSGRPSNIGIFCSGVATTASRNLVAGYAAPIYECADAGNFSNPN